MRYLFADGLFRGKKEQGRCQLYLMHNADFHLIPSLQAKAYLADPSAFAAAAPVATEAAAEAAPAAKEEEKEEEKEESDDDMGFGLFD